MLFPQNEIQLALKSIDGNLKGWWRPNNLDYAKVADPNAEGSFWK